MKISYVTPSDQTTASFRYRVLLPASQLKEHEIYVDSEPELGADITLFSKHWPANIFFAQQARNKGSVIVYDICDDHFSDHLRFEYKSMALRADIITCNSESMKARIKEAIDRDAVVIPDPYEMPYKEPEFNPGQVPKSLWFGHSTNIPVLEKIPLIGDLEIITNCPESKVEDPITWTPYSQKAVMDGLDNCDLVLLPQDKPCKSANRLIEGLRRGKFCLASNIPAYEELKDFCYICEKPEDFREGVYWTLEHPEEVLDRIAAGQKYIEKFSPEEIGRRWERLLSSTLVAAQKS